MIILTVFVGIGLAPQYALGTTGSQQMPEASKALESDLGAVFTSSRFQTVPTVSQKLSVPTRISIGLLFNPIWTENGVENSRSDESAGMNWRTSVIFQPTFFNAGISSKFNSELDSESFGGYHICTSIFGVSFNAFANAPPLKVSHLGCLNFSRSFWSFKFSPRSCSDCIEIATLLDSEFAAFIIATPAFVSASLNWLSILPESSISKINPITKTSQKNAPHDSIKISNFFVRTFPVILSRNLQIISYPSPITPTVTSTMPGCLFANSKTNNEADDIKHIDEQVDFVAPYVLIAALSIFAILQFIRIFLIKN
jgi:hypothetical protein